MEEWEEANKNWAATQERLQREQAGFDEAK